MRRTKEAAATTREQLLQAALEIFRTKGYTLTTLDDIARQAGTTRGAIQWHFGNKAELFNTLQRECYERIAHKFGEIYASNGTPLQILRRMLVRWLGYAEEDTNFRAILELTFLKTEVGPELQGGLQEKIQGNQQAQQGFEGLIRQGIASGEIRSDVNPAVAARSAMGLIHGITNLWLLNPEAFSLKDSAEETIDLFLQGIVCQ
ncbi:MAG TPA: TetR family transcriptional regulator [Ktedonobacteraceae bacterium]|nr:TetR family transcriptional regulator [Ktedonobacteraceae bacterium]